MTLARSQLDRTGFKSRTTEMARSGFLARSTNNGRERARSRSSLKTTQRKPTKSEKILWTRMVEVVGCVACRIDGNANLAATIHHIDGRTKPGCHGLVLPLCAGHHQDATGEDKTLIAVHPYKARFEQRYGTQLRLLAFVHQLLASPAVDGA
jgi:hypothetical protein